MTFNKFLNPKRPVLIILLISGFFGALLGLLHAQYQWLIEPTQILAGLVKYPHSNPFYIISTKTWNIIHQILALALNLGISERTLSFLLSSIVGMVSFQALAVFSIALSHNLLFSLFTPFFVFYLHNTAFPGLTYPIMLLGSDSTYGMLGLSTLILVTALLSLKKYRLGGFLLGLFPAIHATQGLWCNLVIFLVFLLDFKNFKKILKRSYLFLFFGYFISLASLIYHFLYIYDVPHLSHQVLSPYLRAIIIYWGDHYQKFSLLNGNTLRIFASMILSLWGLRFFKKNYSQLFLFRTFIISFFPAAIFSVVYWLPISKAHLYFSILRLFPARLFNYHVLGSLLLLMGLLWQFKNDFLHQLNLCLLAFFLVIYRLLPEGDGIQPLPHSSFSGFMGIVIFLSSLIFVFFAHSKKYSKKYLSTKIQKIISKKNLAYLFRKISVYIFALTIFLTFIRAYTTWQKNQKNYFLDSTNDAFFQKVSQRKGMIIPGPKITWLMLKTRRPLLINGGMGIFNYAPEGSIKMEKILREVYGIDFFNPPKEILNHGRELPPEKVKPLWENRSLTQWRKIKKEFSVSDVVASADWKLQLPQITASNNLILYTIPD